MEIILDEIELEQTLTAIEVNETDMSFIEAFETFGTDALAAFLVEQNA